MEDPKDIDLAREFASAINRQSREGVSNTPDFVLGDFLADTLAAFERASNERDRTSGLARDGGDSNLLQHARREMERAGLEPTDDIMQAAINKNVMDMLQVFSAEEHSGFSAAYTLNLFSLLADFKPLTPLTNDPAEWRDVSTEWGGPCWQNVRDGTAFSEDGGKTYYTLDDTEKVITAEEAP